MAEYIMKDLVSKAGLSERFEISSAATSAWEIGNPVYPPARQKLAEHGIDCNGKTARQMTRLDYARYDHLIGMDESNLCAISSETLCCGSPPTIRRMSHRLLSSDWHG